MPQPNYEALVKQLVSEKASERKVAQMILLSMQEDAIEPLADQYFAGVTDAEGNAILSMIAEIGGYEAIHLLHDVFTHEARPRLRRAAAMGLIKHIHALPQAEREQVAQYLADER